MEHRFPVLNKFFSLYRDGFTNMPDWGRKVWIIIIIKLFIMFVLLKIFFFPDFLKAKYDNDKQRSEYVLDQLTKSPSKND
jgi:hypothetical protein